MCDECGGNLCGMLDDLITDYVRDFPIQTPAPDVRGRPKYMPMDVRNAPKSANDTSRFRELVEHVHDVGLTPIEFLDLLKERSGFPDPIDQWLAGNIPNGLARKVILTCAERILRERGARPKLTLLAA